MKIIQRISLCLLLLVSVQSFGQTPPPEPKKITSVEGITEYELGNGLRVLLFPDQSKSTITVNVSSCKNKYKNSLLTYYLP